MLCHQLPVTNLVCWGNVRVMTRFIVIVFLFLGFAFYELSGGADFDAEETRLSRIDTPPAVTETTLDTEVADASAADPVPETVSRVSLNLTSVQDVVRPAPTLRTKPAVQRASAEPEVAVVSEEEPTIILPSLLVDRPVITPVDFNAPAAAPVSAQSDIRQVTGSSVNVRGGPGTGYAVVNRLSRGDSVEILQDPGNGWVKLRPTGGGTVGWMADFLLSEG